MKYINKHIRKIQKKMIDNSEKYRVGEGDEYLPAERSKNSILSHLSGMSGGQKKIANKIGKSLDNNINKKIEKVYNVSNKIRSKIK